MHALNRSLARELAGFKGEPQNNLERLLLEPSTGFQFKPNVGGGSRTSGSAGVAANSVGVGRRARSADPDSTSQRPLRRRAPRGSTGGLDGVARSTTTSSFGSGGGSGGGGGSVDEA